jgi:hypothetical protein
VEVGLELIRQPFQRQRGVRPGRGFHDLVQHRLCQWLQPLGQAVEYVAITCIQQA